MSKIEGYAIRVGVYVEMSYYIEGSDEQGAVNEAVSDFESTIDGLEFDPIDIEVLNCEPEYHEDD
jgi:hypothetical protein